MVGARVGGVVAVVRREDEQIVLAQPLQQDPQIPVELLTDTGFPPELIAELEKRCGKRVIGNKSASGTAILEELAEEEIT